MPLRDHFHPPVSKRSSWEGLHALWPGTMVQRLVNQLPPNYVAEPRVDIGAQYGYEMLVFDVDRERELVAAVEIVSPANKDRPENRQIFVAKCAACLGFRFQQVGRLKRGRFRGRDATADQTGRRLSCRVSGTKLSQPTHYRFCRGEGATCRSDIHRRCLQLGRPDRVFPPQPRAVPNGLRR